MTEFKFSFKNFEERVNWEWKNELVDYDCVRIKCFWKDGHSVDYPSKSEEEFNEDIERMRNNENVDKWEVYQVSHFYEEKIY